MERLINQALRAFQLVDAPTWRRILLSFVAFVLPLIVFVQLADEVAEQDTLIFDQQVLIAINGISNTTLDQIVVSTTDFGYVWWVGFATLVAFLLCIKARMYRRALIVVVGVAGSALANIILKLIFQRDRPELWELLISEDSFSFPSGHAMASASIAAVIIVILWPTKWRYIAILLGSIYVLYIGFTRMYLGVHYPTDIVAGWLVTSLWVAITALVILRLPYKRT